MSFSIHKFRTPINQMTTSSAFPAIFVSKLWVVGSFFSFFKSFFFFLFILLNVLNQNILDLLLSLKTLFSHFFHLLLEIFWLLLIKLCNFFLGKHAAINCEPFLQRCNNFYCIKGDFENTIGLINESFLEFRSNLFDLI